MGFAVEWGSALPLAQVHRYSSCRDAAQLAAAAVAVAVAVVVGSYSSQGRWAVVETLATVVVGAQERLDTVAEDRRVASHEVYSCWMRLLRVLTVLTTRPTHPCRLALLLDLSATRRTQTLLDEGSLVKSMGTA